VCHDPPEGFGMPRTSRSAGCSFVVRVRARRPFSLSAAGSRAARSPWTSSNSDRETATQLPLPAAAALAQRGAFAPPAPWQADDKDLPALAEKAHVIFEKLDPNSAEHARISRAEKFLRLGQQLWGLPCTGFSTTVWIGAPGGARHTSARPRPADFRPGLVVTTSFEVPSVRLGRPDAPRDVRDGSSASVPLQSWNRSPTAEANATLCEHLASPVR
jgi:hypothetical protein